MIFSVYVPSSGISESYLFNKNKSTFILNGISILFSIVAVSISIHTNSAIGFHFIHTLTSFCRFLNNDHSDWWGVIISVQLLSCVQLFATAWITAHQVSLYISNYQSLLKLMSIKLVMPSNHLILCCPLLNMSSICLSITIFSNESVLHIRWSKYWSLSFSVSLSNEFLGLIFFRIGLGSISLQSKEHLRVFSNTTVQKHQFFGVQLSL